MRIRCQNMRIFKKAKCSSKKIAYLYCPLLVLLKLQELKSHNKVKTTLKAKVKKNHLTFHIKK